jgi:Mg-chelatase subunit ChlD
VIADRDTTAMQLANQVLGILRKDYSQPELSLLLKNFSKKKRNLNALAITQNFTIGRSGDTKPDASTVFEFLRRLYILLCMIDKKTAIKMRPTVISFAERTEAVVNFLTDAITNIVREFKQDESEDVLASAGEDFLSMRLFAMVCSELLKDMNPEESIFGRIRDMQLVDNNILSINIAPGAVKYENIPVHGYMQTFNRVIVEILKYYAETGGNEGIKKFFTIFKDALSTHEILARTVNARGQWLNACLAERIKVDITGIERIIESGCFPRHGIVAVRCERIAEGIAFANAIAKSFNDRYGAMAIALSTISIEEYIDMSSILFDAEDIQKSIFVDWYTARHKPIEAMKQEGRIITCSSDTISLEMGFGKALDNISYAPLKAFLFEIASGAVDADSPQFSKLLDTIHYLAQNQDTLFVLVTDKNAPRSFDAKIENISDGIFDIYHSEDELKIKAVQIRWEEPDYTDYTLVIEGRKIEIGIRRKKKKERKTLEEELGLVEEDPVDRYRTLLGRAYNYRIVENEFLMCVRVPKENVDDITDADVHTIIQKLHRENLEKMKEKILSVYVICDNNYVEMDIHRFIDAINMRRASPIHRAAEEIRKLRIGERDPVIRKLLDDLSKTGARVGARLRRGSKAAEVTTTAGRGRVVGYKQAGENPQDIALLPTIRVAAMKGRGKGKFFAVEIKKEDFQEKIRKTRTPVYLCFVVDTSGYEEPEVRGKIVTALVISMLKDAYERRDQVALVTYSGNHATVQCNFTTDVEYVGAYMKRVEFGGLTPLGSALMTGLGVLHAKVGDRVGVVPILILLTTGTANVPVVPGGNIRRELLTISRQIWNSGYKMLVIDISERGSNLARELALLTGGRYYHPQNLKYQKIVLTRNLLDALRTKDVKTAIEASKKFLKER